MPETIGAVQAKPPELNLLGVQALGMGLGTLIRRLGAGPGIVTLVLLALGVTPFSVPCVGSQVNRDVRVMSSTPGKVIGHAVMGSRMEQHRDVPLTQLIQIA